MLTFYVRSYSFAKNFFYGQHKKDKTSLTKSLI
jgi:hypothetical protein